MRKKTGEKKGFTLIEVLVSMAIFTILFGFTIAAFQQTRKIERLRGSTLQLVSDLQKAQNYASTGIAQSGTVPVGGYGVHLEKNATSYKIFADVASVKTGSPCTCDSSNSRENQRYDDFISGFCPACPDPLVGETKLQSNVIIYSIVDSLLGLQDYLDVAFKPLSRQPFVGYGKDAEFRDPASGTYDSKSGRTVEIKFKLKDSNICRKVTVRGSIGQFIESSTDCL
jgi:prepilin-type N-terminal cleavage/methylation domain-containing protein